MKYDRLYNFISPVTGKIPIDRGYILLGDKDGMSFASPVLIDVRQDIIDLKRKIGNFEELKKLDHNRIWIGDYYNEPQETLHIGIINLPPLAEAVFPNPISSIIGDFRIPNPTFDYLSPFDWVMSGPFLPQIYATKYDTFGNPIGTDISSSLAMTQVRAAQIMKRFDNATFIVGSSVVDFTWENPKMYLIPETLKQLYGLGTTYTFTKAQSLGNLQTGILKNTVNNAIGTLSTAIAGKDYVEVTAPIENMQIALIRPELIQEGADVAKLLSRVERLPVANMSLTKDKYWKGGDNDIPIEVDLPTDATYIIKTPNVNLPEAQVLEELGMGMAKIVSGGAFAIAVSGQDYATSEQLQEYAEQAAASAEEAAVSAGEAAAAAAEATGAAAEATAAAGEASVSAGAAGVSAAAAAASAVAAGISAGSASSSASDASSSASDANHSASSASGSATNAANSATEAQTYLNTLLNTELTMQGDVNGNGLLSMPIVTTFKPNPIFTGNGSITIPSGTIEQRPNILVVGMIRIVEN